MCDISIVVDIGSKACSKCGQEKDLSLFYIQTQTGREMPHCKECHKSSVLRSRAKKPEKYRRYREEYQRSLIRAKGRSLFFREQKGLCPTCRRPFDRSTHNHTYCRPVCQVRARTLRLKFDLPPGTWAELYERAGRKCSACSNWQDLAIDHCHKTNLVRGLLCKRCNLALGQLEDDPYLLRSLAQYLELHQ